MARRATMLQVRRGERRTRVRGWAGALVFNVKASSVYFFFMVV